MEGYEFNLLWGLRENVCNLLISPNVIEIYGALLYHISNEVVPDIDMLGSIMEHEILRKTNPTLVMTNDNSGI